MQTSRPTKIVQVSLNFLQSVLILPEGGMGHHDQFFFGLRGSCWVKIIETW